MKRLRMPPRLAGRLRTLSAIGAMALLAMLLIGCSRPTIGTDPACIAFAPIYPSRADTAETKRQIAVHDKTGEALCGWKPG